MERDATRVVEEFFDSVAEKQVIERPSFSALAQAIRDNFQHRGITVECKNNEISLVRIDG